jgi:hypothetical protein
LNSTLKRNAKHLSINTKYFEYKKRTILSAIFPDRVKAYRCKYVMPIKSDKIYWKISMQVINKIMEKTHLISDVCFADNNMEEIFFLYNTTI